MRNYSVYRPKEEYALLRERPLSELLQHGLRPELDTYELITGPKEWSGTLEDLIRSMSKEQLGVWEMHTVKGLAIVTCEDGVTRAWFVESERVQSEMSFFLGDPGDKVRAGTEGIHVRGSDKTWKAAYSIMIDNVSYAALRPDEGRESHHPVVRCSDAANTGLRAPGSFTEEIIREIRRRNEQQEATENTRQFYLELDRKAREEEQVPAETIQGREVTGVRISVRKMLAEQQAILAAKNKKKK